MKLRPNWRMFLPTRANWLLSCSRSFFLIIGVLALSYCAFALLDARLYQAYQSWRFQQAVDGLKPPVGSAEHPQPPPLAPALVEANRAGPESLGIAGRRGSPVGRIEIGAIGLTAMILEGIDKGTLRRAVGHIPGTPLPGQQGNVAIAGHRDTFFRALRNIRKDHEITLTTLNGSYLYRVDSTKVVAPEDTEVLDDSDEAILTLVTCYPFTFIGHAPKRFVVRARRIPG